MENVLATSGFTLATVGARIQAMDFDANGWKAYVALCTLALIRGSDKKALVKRIFGDEKQSSNFKGAWSIALAVFGHMDNSAKSEIADKGIDEAVKLASAFHGRHMDTLGVKGKNAYVAVMHFASAEEMAGAKALATQDNIAEANVKAAAEAEAEAKAEATRAELTAAAEAENAAWIAAGSPPRHEADAPSGMSVADVMAILADKDDAFLAAIGEFIAARLAPAIEQKKAA